jgi:hypothetical protein
MALPTQSKSVNPKFLSATNVALRITLKRTRTTAIMHSTSYEQAMQASPIVLEPRIANVVVVGATPPAAAMPTLLRERTGDGANTGAGA